MSATAIAIVTGLLLGGCDWFDDDSKSQPAQPADPVEPQEDLDVGVSPAEGEGEDASEEEEVGEPEENSSNSGCERNKYYCIDNSVYRCVGDRELEKIVDCEGETCNEDLGVCVNSQEPRYVCDTQHVLNFNEETVGAWQHHGKYSCEGMCPWDPENGSHPVFQDVSTDPDQSIYFEAPVCPNADLVRLVFDGRTTSGQKRIRLRLPFRRDPYELLFASENQCNGSAFSIADFESEADFKSIIRDGKLAVTLEPMEFHYGHVFGLKDRVGGECFTDNSPLTDDSWNFGLSRVTVVSCFEDFKPMDASSGPHCENPSCEEVGAARCFEDVLKECTDEGWVWREQCGPDACFEEEERCLDYMEVCSEPEEFIFHSGTRNQYTAGSNALRPLQGYSCEALCENREGVTEQPVFRSSSYVAHSFSAPEGFDEPTKVHFDIVSRHDEGDSNRIVSIADRIRKNQVHFPISCAPHRVTFSEEEGNLVEGGLIQFKIGERGSGYTNIPNFDPDRDNREEACSESGINTYGGIDSVTMTVCKMGYR